MRPSPIRRVCVYCGSRPGARLAYAEAARSLGTLLAEAGIGLVTGGGRVGLMGVVADAVLAAGGEAVGVIPHALAEREVGHDGLTALHVVASMHERKATMADLADAFVALPGGLGTLEEIAEMLTWAQLGLHDKPCGLLDVEGYYAPLVAFVDHAVGEGFVGAEHRAALVVEAEPAALLDRLRSAPPRP
ncbi:TIGR00730 family Rossman fold protein [Rubrivirga sp. S365]|uniref:Cytokinin riboside 5'-monophosphate phosphoribohydrolase n=1 Tax=Rubrivirga litoralis TaxID=3075598 RepID=A0ABU3BT01_9BACT|nr:MULTISPECIES: TIGR00730 family Rossman fold protein [unclassified Rubrivirga]MDT0632417.1 TIGR00730 family Rossman fold protein [Rubrivirga sp. F394]MDT7855212.1 TIGR00730 family Rossman fold protein [Rubrivirga sp. S365]